MSRRVRRTRTRPIMGRSRRSGAGTEAARSNTLGLDRIKIRLAVFALILLAIFIGLSTRLWFLQVLATDSYRVLARENRVRRVDSEPPRGRILDRNGVVLVDNRPSRAVTIDRQVLDTEQTRVVLRRLSKLLEVPRKELRENLLDGTVSPYKPVAVVNDVTEAEATQILVHRDRFRGVDIEELPVRTYPQGQLASHILGYVGEISEEELEESQTFRGVRPPYRAGDIVGKSGVERTYDKFLRGKPRIEKVVVNSAGKVVGERTAQQQAPGNDLYLTLDTRIQRIAEQALESGILAARGGGLPATDGAVVVLDPRNGEVRAIASYPTYKPSLLADGITQKEFDRLGQRTPEDPKDDALTNRGIFAEQAPGSTFKVLTAGAALALGVIDPFGGLNCTAAETFPPGGGPGSVTLANWTSAVPGYVDVPTALEISCNTFFYQLGWAMETQWGESLGDGTERYQKYMHRAGLGSPTGVDLPYENDGVVPNWAWCKANKDIGFCDPDGDGQQTWYPGYTVNMAIGQGDLKVTPIQMAMAYASIANGGAVWRPHVGLEVREPPTAEGDQDVSKEGKNDSALVKDVKPKRNSTLPLDETQIARIQEGLSLVVEGGSGTANSVFAGFPLDQFPVAGKTGTAQRGETGQNDSWFVSYGPADSPRYVIATYVELGDHGGTTSAPIARQVWEGIAALEGIGGVDKDTGDVSLASDSSG